VAWNRAQLRDLQRCAAGESPADPWPWLYPNCEGEPEAMLNEDDRPQRLLIVDRAYYAIHVRCNPYKEVGRGLD